MMSVMSNRHLKLNYTLYPFAHHILTVNVYNNAVHTAKNAIIMFKNEQLQNSFRVSYHTFRKFR